MTPCLIPGSFKVELYCNDDFSSLDGTSPDRQGQSLKLSVNTLPELEKNTMINGLRTRIFTIP